jgi:carboxypeptidase PM20D1
MVKPPKAILVSLALVPLALLVVIAARTVQFRSRQMAVAPSTTKFEIDAAAVQRLARALQHRTILDPDGDAATSLEFTRFHEFLQTSFPRVHATLVREVVGQHSLLYTWPGFRGDLKPLLLLGHTDVIPVESGSETKWRHPPFAGRIVDGYIWGRGAMDNKVNVLGILEAVEHLLAQGFRPQRTAYLAFGHDEETGGQRGAAKIAAVLRERKVDIDFVLDEGGAIADGIVPGVGSPVAMIGIGEKGYLSLELTVSSPGGHSSVPAGASAIGILSRAIDKIESQPFPARIDGAVREFFNFVGPEMTWVNKALLANLWLFEPLLKWQLGKSPLTETMIRTTQAATLFQAGTHENVLPTHARAVINFRLISGDTIDAVTARIRQVIDDPRVNINQLPGKMEPSPVPSSDTDAFKLLQRTVHQIAPEAIVAPYLTIAATDAQHYAKLTKNIYRFTPITVGKDDINRFHGTDERVSEQDYVRCVRFYMQLLRDASGASE